MSVICSSEEELMTLRERWRLFSNSGGVSHWLINDRWTASDVLIAKWTDLLREFPWEGKKRERLRISGRHSFTGIRIRSDPHPQPVSQDPMIVKSRSSPWMSSGFHI
jgi:hypothetical protein